ncbi:Serine-threonine/tyrosine-protein kinase [Theobroma cacao]|nr:Serine-threonine/tyrosine-protein kinase [Theobroma cacao]
MLAARLLFAVTAVVFLALPRETCNAKGNHHCSPPSCGSIQNISYPFRLNSDPHNCGVPRYNLSCQNNLTVLNLKSGKYYVQAINYNNYTIRLVDAGVQKGNCSSIPQYSLSYNNFTSGDIAPYSLSSWTYNRSKNILFLNCSKPVNAHLYLHSSPCLDDAFSSNFWVPESKGYLYVKIGRTKASDLSESCRIELMAMTSLLGKDEKNITFLDIHDELAYGFELSWSQVYCGDCRWWPRNLCIIDEANHVYCGWTPFVGTLVGMVIGTIGGYGSVYKGKLRSGRIAAIKMLSKSKADGQDFINEVATIGRIHHVNVVQLIGFCAKGSKRALVYDFMPNGSLDKYIFSPERCTTLSWKKTYEIAVGVAHGIEYLHRGNNVNEVGDATEEDKEMIKKMSIVALWCIQMKPSDRPSMSKVVEMLEGGLESLQVPPKPLLYPEERVGDQTNETESSSALSLVG